MTAAQLTDRLRNLLAAAPVIDGHNDLPWEIRCRVGYDLSDLDLALDQTAIGLHTDLGRMRAGGMGAQFWSVFVPDRLTGDAAVAATLEQIDFVHHLVDRFPDRLALARTADEVEAAHASGRIASLIGVEGGHSIASSMGTLRAFHALGARYLTLTHVHNTPWADSATDVVGVGGLSDFGREVVRECNRLGVMVDLAHVAPSTMHASLDISTAPAFFSHSSARALCDSPRNVPDDVLARVRETDGVVMVTFVCGFLNEECRVWMNLLIAFEDALAQAYPQAESSWHEARASWLAEHPRPACSVTDVADHIEHVRDVAGVGAVGIGSDFDGMLAAPDGLSGVDSYPNLLAELARRGWSDAELAGLTWGNTLRVMRATEAASRQARAERGPSLAVLTAVS
jgi:membrane dipeptidase